MRALTVLACFGLTACITDVNLGSNTTPLAAPTPTTINLGGALCTPVVTSPVKIVIALDATQSLSVTDPQGSRGAAVRSLIDNLPQDPAVSVAVVLFRGSTLSWLTRSGNAEFDAVTDLDATARSQLVLRIVNFTSPGPDSTDFVTPLSSIYSLLVSDISQHVGSEETRARYAVVFLSDGAPTTNQDDELICGDAVRRIRQLRDLTDDVTLHTVHVYSPALTACTGDAGVITDPACGFAQLPPGTCPKTIVDQDARRLDQMAQLGGGTFQDFRDGSQVAFNLSFAPVQRRLVLDKVVASNLSAPARSVAGIADSDGDGLMDDDEANEGTQALVTDSDGDGFSDGVEIYARTRGANLSPLQMDVGCPTTLRGVDTDCDGLPDCDEQLIGSNAQRLDSDDDGVPDTVEFKLGSQAASRDLSQDPDSDSLSTGVELAAHLDPLSFDASPTTTDYRYTVTRRAAIEPDGSQCWDFTVANVRLADTVSGLSDVFVSYSMVWEDLPAGRTFMRKVRRSTSTDVTSLLSTDFGQCP